MSTNIDNISVIQKAPDKVTDTGYAGLSITTFLVQHHKITAVNIVPKKTNLANQHESLIQDEYIEKHQTEKEVDLTATLDVREAHSDVGFVVITTPTNVWAMGSVLRRDYFCTDY